jgi:hypothetical protein
MTSSRRGFFATLAALLAVLTGRRAIAKPQAGLGAFTFANMSRGVVRGRVVPAAEDTVREIRCVTSGPDLPAMPRGGVVYEYRQRDWLDDFVADFGSR